MMWMATTISGSCARPWASIHHSCSPLCYFNGGLPQALNERTSFDPNQAETRLTANHLHILPILLLTQSPSSTPGVIDGDILQNDVIKDMSFLHLERVPCNEVVSGIQVVSSKVFEIHSKVNKHHDRSKVKVSDKEALQTKLVGDR